MHHSRNQSQLSICWCSHFCHIEFSLIAPYPSAIWANHNFLTKIEKRSILAGPTHEADFNYCIAQWHHDLQIHIDTEEFLIWFLSVLALPRQLLTLWQKGSVGLTGSNSVIFVWIHPKTSKISKHYRHVILWLISTSNSVIRIWKLYLIPAFLLLIEIRFFHFDSQSLILWMDAGLHFLVLRLSLLQCLNYILWRKSSVYDENLVFRKFWMLFCLSCFFSRRLLLLCWQSSNCSSQLFPPLF